MTINACDQNESILFDTLNYFSNEIEFIWYLHATLNKKCVFFIGFGL